jgi:DNA (cytosine-5)-methyltransferase 1
MEKLPDGGTPNDLPEELRPKSGFANTYCRLWWNRPSPTITRNLSTPSSSRCIHPKAPRPLTTREGARIQCFPDDYIFYGSRSDKNLQIGNAVPTFLSSALKDSIKEHFLNSKYIDIANQRLSESVVYLEQKTLQKQLALELF